MLLTFRQANGSVASTDQDCGILAGFYWLRPVQVMMEKGVPSCPKLLMIFIRAHKLTKNESGLHIRLPTIELFHYLYFRGILGIYRARIEFD